MAQDENGNTDFPSCELSRRRCKRIDDVVLPKTIDCGIARPLDSNDHLRADPSRRLIDRDNRGRERNGAEVGGVLVHRRILCWTHHGVRHCYPRSLHHEPC